MHLNPTKRFSDRVENYRRYRPSYPRAVIDLIKSTAALSDGSAVADIGSGTGILTRLLLEAGLEVTAVEPNEAMRLAAEADSVSGVSGEDGAAGGGNAGDDIAVAVVRLRLYSCE